MENNPNHKIQTAARSWVGTRFKHQGRLKAKGRDRGGVDCIGLLVGIAKELEIRNPNGTLLHLQDDTGYSREPNKYKLQDYFDRFLIKSETIEAGSILLVKYNRFPQHCGVVGSYVNNDLSIIHAYETAGKVVEHRLTDKWLKMVVGVYRFPGQF